MPYDHPLSLGGAGVSGTLAANVIGAARRTSSSASAPGSRTSRRRPRPRSRIPRSGSSTSTSRSSTPTSTPRCPLVGDARATLEELAVAVGDYSTSAEYRERVAALNREWDAEVERVYHHSVGDILTQGEVIGAVEASTDARDVVVTSAGSLPGDLLKLWRSRDASSYQVEYGYSTMGYEIAGGVGAKLAAPDREVYVMVGDGSFQMMSNEITTAVQEGLKLIVVIVDNKGFSSVGRVSEQVGAEGFGCHYRLRGPSGAYDGPEMRLDFVKMCQGMGAKALEVSDARRAPRPPSPMPAPARRRCASWSRPTGTSGSRGYANSWWEMATPQVSEMPAVNAAREEFDRNKGRQRYLMIPGAPFQGAGPER